MSKAKWAIIDQIDCNRCPDNDACDRIPHECPKINFRTFSVDNPEILRNNYTLCVIDKTHFNGCVECILINGKTKYTQLTLPQIKQHFKKELEVISLEEFEKLREEYKEGLLTSFKEIDGELFHWELYQPIKRAMLYDGILSFFTASGPSYDICYYYFSYKNSYFRALKRTSNTDDQLIEEVKQFIAQFELSTKIYGVTNAEDNECISE